MRQVSEQLAAILDDGHYETSLTIDTYYGADRTMQGIPVSPAWELQWAKNADIPGTGSCMAQYSSLHGESLTPREFTDNLAPFGQTVAVNMTVTAGGQSETVQVALWRIVDVPAARDDTLRQTSTITVGSYVDLTLADQLEAVRAAGFTTATVAGNGSAWDELQNLTGMSVLRNLPDVSIPSDVVYELREGARLGAVQRLANALGGSPYVMSDGTLTVLPDEIGTPVAEYDVDKSPALLRTEYALSSDGVYNEVVGLFEDALRQPIVRVAQILDGPLSVHGPFGHRTDYWSNPSVTTIASAESAVRNRLNTVVNGKAAIVPIEARIDPRREVGDTVTVVADGRRFDGMVRALKFRSNGTMLMDVSVDSQSPVTVL